MTTRGGRLGWAGAKEPLELANRPRHRGNGDGAFFGSDMACGSRRGIWKVDRALPLPDPDPESDPDPAFQLCARLLFFFLLPVHHLQMEVNAACLLRLKGKAVPTNPSHHST